MSVLVLPSRARRRWPKRLEDLVDAPGALQLVEGVLDGLHLGLYPVQRLVVLGRLVDGVLDGLHFDLCRGR